MQSPQNQYFALLPTQPWGQVVLGCCGALTLLAIVEFLPAPRHTYFWDSAYDTGHILIFGLGTSMALLIARAIQRPKRLAHQYWMSGILTFVVGLAVELWQSQSGRTAEWIDVQNDAVGILTSGLLHATFDRRITAPRKWVLSKTLLSISAITILLLGLLPFAQTVRMYSVRSSLFPILIDYAEPWYGLFYYEQSATIDFVPPPGIWPHQNQSTRVAKLRLQDGAKYPGFVFREPHPNWSEYAVLEFDIVLDDPDEQTFVFRIHDTEHDGQFDDRFNGPFRLHPGFQTVKLPLSELQKTTGGRLLDLSRIESFAIFTINPSHDLSLYLGEIRLVR